MRLMDRPHRVYRHFAADGTLLYIGVTTKPYERAVMHRTHSAWWPEVAYIVSSEWMRREDALALEVHLIRRHLPPYNRMVAQRSTFVMGAAS